MTNTSTVLNYLNLHCRGAAFARTKKQLARELFGDESFARSVEQAIRDLRKHEHAKIASSCSGVKGYFIAETVEEWERFKLQVDSRFKEAEDLRNVANHILWKMRQEEVRRKREAAPQQTGLNF